MGTFVKKLRLLAVAATIGAIANTATAAEKELNVVWMGWKDALVNPLLEMFKEAHPDVKVNIEKIPFAQLFQTMEVRLSARNADPDVFIADGTMSASYGTRGHLLDLTPYLNTDGFSAASLRAASWNGKIYTVPFGTSMQLLYYNKDLFEKAGIEPPSSDPETRWTWEQVLEAAKKIRDPENGTWGLVITQADRPFQLLPLAQSLGGVAVSEDGLTAKGYVDSEEFVKAYTFYQDLYNKWDVAPAGQFQINLNQEMFATGKAGMLIGATWNLGTLLQHPDTNWGAALHPYFEGGVPVTPTGAWHFGINPRTDNLEDALKFMEFFATDELQAKWLTLRPYAPVRDAVWEMEKEFFAKSDGWALVHYELDNTAVPRPGIPGWREYEDIMLHAFQDINGGTDVRTRLEEAAEKIEREVAKYK